jgi:hypothetical protein
MASTQAELMAYAALSHANALEVLSKMLAPAVPVTSGSSVDDIIGLINGVHSPLEGEMHDLPDIGAKVSGKNLDDLIKQLGKKGRYVTVHTICPPPWSGAGAWWASLAPFQDHDDRQAHG